MSDILGYRAAIDKTAENEWFVELRSRNYLAGTTVHASSMFSAIEKALIELEDEDGVWPWSCVDCDITARRIES